jgi:peptidyl-prolyl cis-trans isomerase SurA
MNKKIQLLLLALLISPLSFNTHALNFNDHEIVVLVNDKIITSYDILQRMKMNAILSRNDITIENNEQIRNLSVNELIQEELKNEKISEFDILVSNEEYIRQENQFYKNSVYEQEDLINIFELNDIKYDDFKNFLINQISWQKLISRMYYRMTSASDIEIDEIVANNPSITVNEARNIIIDLQLELKSSKMIRDMLDEATIEHK